MVSDLISRQAAIEAFEDTTFTKNEIQRRLSELPSAQPERKSGKWGDLHTTHKAEGAKIEEWQSAKCSVCGKYHTTPYMYFFKEYNYCPNCGARMETGDET